MTLDPFHVTWSDIARLNNHTTVFDASDYLPGKWNVSKSSDGTYGVNWEKMRLHLEDNHPMRDASVPLSAAVKLNLLDKQVERLTKSRKFLKRLFRDLEGVPELDAIWDEFPENIDPFDAALERAQRRLNTVFTAYRIAFNQLVQ
jgi:hypothetical protein